MRSKHHVVYIPGLGDAYDPGRRFALRFWKLYGVTTELVPMRWRTETDYTEKYDRVITAIELATQKNLTVSLVADSAGASLALTVFANRPELHNLVTLCGVNSPAIHLNPTLSKKHPALQVSIDTLPSSLKRITKSHVTSFRSRLDPVVYDRYSYIPGATHRRIPAIGHNSAIMAALTIWSFLIVRTIKKS